MRSIITHKKNNALVIHNPSHKYCFHTNVRRAKAQFKSVHTHKNAQTLDANEAIEANQKIKTQITDINLMFYPFQRNSNISK